MRTPAEDEPRLLLDKALEAQLTHDFGWQFEGPFYTEVPTPLPENVHGCNNEIAWLQQHLLKTKIILDQFGQKHAARRVFLDEHRLSEFVKKYGKLKGNNLLGAIFSIDTIMGGLKNKNPRLHKKLSEICTPEILRKINTYKTMELKEKIQYARELDDVIYRFLEALA